MTPPSLLHFASLSESLSIILFYSLSVPFALFGLPSSSFLLRLFVSPRLFSFCPYLFFFLAPPPPGTGLAGPRDIPRNPLKAPGRALGGPREAPAGMSGVAPGSSLKCPLMSGEAPLL